MLTEDGVVLRLTAKGEYIFPKGHIESGESPEQAAIREVAEETGLEAEVVAKLGETTFTYQGDEYRVAMFLARVTQRLDEWEQHSGRDAVEVPWTGVRDILAFENLRLIWDRAEPFIRPAGGGL